MKEITYAVLGFGGRGREFTAISQKPELFTKIVAVAEPHPERRAQIVKELNLDPNKAFKTAEDLLAQPRLADAVINTTQDQMHARTSIPAMEKGYHLLLEKPMAVTLDDCLAIEQTQRKTGRVVAVCHSLRYNLVFAAVKKILDAGALGQIVSFDHIEQIGDIHFSSSFVRGPWGNEKRSTFMLMAKCCHDLDLFCHLFNQPCKRVSSFGSLTYFTEKNKPAGAPARCLDGCPAAAQCPYHCGKVYLEDQFWRGIGFCGQDDQTIVQQLRTGPYGKCVFQTDNDVADHQVVAFEFQDGLTGTFTATAFAPGGRFLRIHGTNGYLEANLGQSTIVTHDFVTRNKQTLQVPDMIGSHGGGDYLVFKNLTEAIRVENPQAVLTTAQASLESHKLVFAAEQARKTGRVVELC